MLPPHLPLSWVCVQTNLLPAHHCLSLLALRFPSANSLLIHVVTHPGIPGWLRRITGKKTCGKVSAIQPCLAAWEGPSQIFLMRCSLKPCCLFPRVSTGWIPGCCFHITACRTAVRLRAPSFLGSSGSKSEHFCAQQCLFLALRLVQQSVGSSATARSSSLRRWCWCL